MSNFTYRVRIHRPGGGGGRGGFKTHADALAHIESMHTCWENTQTSYYIDEVEETETERIVNTLTEVRWERKVTPVFDDAPRVYDRSIYG